MTEDNTAKTLFILVGGFLAHYCESDDERFLDGALEIIDKAIQYYTTGERQVLPIADLLDELEGGEYLQ